MVCGRVRVLSWLLTISEPSRIAITGVGLTAPNGNNLATFRESLLSGRSGVQSYEIRYVGTTVAGVCDFDELRYQRRKELRRGTRAGSVGIYLPGKRWPTRAWTGTTRTSRRSAFTWG